jgi:hypothetical protein
MKHAITALKKQVVEAVVNDQFDLAHHYLIMLKEMYEFQGFQDKREEEDLRRITVWFIKEVLPKI